MLKLKTGEIYEDQFGNTSGDFVAVVSSIDVDASSESINVSAKIYANQAALTSEKRPVFVKGYQLDESGYSTVLNAIKNRAVNHNEDMVEAIYSLLLTRSFWSNWEKA